MSERRHLFEHPQDHIVAKSLAMAQRQLGVAATSYEIEVATIDAIKTTAWDTDPTSAVAGVSFREAYKQDAEGLVTAAFKDGRELIAYATAVLRQNSVLRPLDIMSAVVQSKYSLLQVASASTEFSIKVLDEVRLQQYNPSLMIVDDTRAPSRVLWRPDIRRDIRAEAQINLGCPALTSVVTDSEGGRMTTMHYFWDDLVMREVINQ